MIKSVELYEKLHPTNEQRTECHYDPSTGLSFNTSSIFSQLIKDAARCNGYNSDVYYDLKGIDQRLESYNPDKEFDPVWIGFRKLGVDGTAFVLSRCDDKESVFVNLDRTYFALYSFMIEKNDDRYYAVFREYAV